MNCLYKNLTFAIILTVLTAFNLAGQNNKLPIFPIDSLTGKITYTDVVYLDSTVTQQELFTTSRQWFAKTFKSSKDVLRMEDKEEGVLIGKGSFQAYINVLGSPMASGFFQFTISLYFKNGRYKYEITDLLYRSDTMGETTCEHLYFAKEKDYPRWTNKGAIQYFSQLKTEMESIIKRLKDSMVKTAASNKEKW